MYVRVQPDIAKIEKTYWYVIGGNTKNAEKIVKGSIVRIEVNGRKNKGWVLEISSDVTNLNDGDKNLDVSELKEVIEFVSVGPPPHLVNFSLELSKYYLCSPVIFLRASSPLRIINFLDYVYTENEPTKKGNTLYLVDPRADRRELIQDLISDDGSTLIVSPDNHSRLLKWLSEQIQPGLECSVYVREGHNIKSSFEQSSKNNSVVIGSRSALFAPNCDLKSIILLDDAYEQLQEDRTPKWKAIDCAKMLGDFLSIPLSVISSVPSVSTYDLETVDLRKASHLYAKWPFIEIDDKKNNDPALGNSSKKVINLITQTHKIGMDVAVVLNNKSYSKFLVCKKCESIATCENCGHSVEQKGSEESFNCEVCGDHRPAICLVCNSSLFKKYRKGTRSTVKDYEALFPNAWVTEITSETINSVAEQIDNSKQKIFISTESIFHNKALCSNLGSVIFLEIDSIIFRPSISAFEQSLVLINRALRAIKTSSMEAPVLISTKNKDHQFLKDILKKDFFSQRHHELEIRKAANLFPYTATAEITSTKEAIDELAKEMPSDLVVGINKNQDQANLFIRAKDHETLSLKAYELLRKFASKHRCAISIDQYD